jgi:hypothetical protein
LSAVIARCTKRNDPVAVKQLRKTTSKAKWSPPNRPIEAAFVKFLAIYQRFQRYGILTPLPVGAYLASGQKSMRGRILSSEALKNPRKNPAWKNLVERFAIFIGIDPQGHCLPRLIANQTDRKLVGTLAGNDSRTLDPSHD